MLFCCYIRKPRGCRHTACVTLQIFDARGNMLWRREAEHAAAVSRGAGRDGRRRRGYGPWRAVGVHRGARSNGWRGPSALRVGAHGRGGLLRAQKRSRCRPGAILAGIVGVAAVAAFGAHPRKTRRRVPDGWSRRRSHNLPEGLAIGAGYAAFPALGIRRRWSSLHDLPRLGPCTAAQQASIHGGLPAVPSPVPARQAGAGHDDRRISAGGWLFR